MVTISMGPIDIQIKSICLQDPNHIYFSLQVFYKHVAEEHISSLYCSLNSIPYMVVQY